MVLIEDSEDSFNKKHVLLSSLPSPAHTHPIAEVDNLQAVLDGKEDAFSKNTAFNANFGTGAGEVAEGNHTHADYAALSHTHTVADVAGLQSALDSKVETVGNDGATGHGLVSQSGNSVLVKRIEAGTNVVITDNGDHLVIEAAGGGGGGGGTSDHGALIGLNDDDHPQYHNDARGDARYSQLGHTHTEYAATSHTHAVSEVTGLQSALDGKLSDAVDSGTTGTSIIEEVTNGVVALKRLEAGSNITLTDNGDRVTIESTASGGGVTDHGALTGLDDDDHPQYHNDARGDARYSQLGHGHAISEVTNLQQELDSKADGTHTHAIADTTGLQAALDQKASLSHTHAVSDVTGLQGELDGKLENVGAAGATGESIVNSVSGGSALLKRIEAGTNVTVTDNGDRLTIDATVSGGVTDHGAMTGLDDDDHPQYHNDARGDARYSQLGHGHAIADTTGLQDALDDKADATHAHTIAQVTGLQGALDGKSDTGHTHTGFAADNHTHAIADTTGLQAALDQKASLSHTHTIAETTGLQDALDDKADANHTHSGFALSSHTHGIGDVTNLQAELDGKAAVSHSHAIADTTGLQAALDGKADASHTHTEYAATSHTHAIADVTNLQTELDGKVDSVANTGSGTPLVVTPTGSDVQVRGISAGNGIALALNPNDVQVSLAPGAPYMHLDSKMGYMQVYQDAALGKLLSTDVQRIEFGRNGNVTETGSLYLGNTFTDVRQGFNVPADMTIVGFGFSAKSVDFAGDLEFRFWDGKTNSAATSFMNLGVAVPAGSGIYHTSSSFSLNVDIDEGSLYTVRVRVSGGNSLFNDVRFDVYTKWRF